MRSYSILILMVLFGVVAAQDRLQIKELAPLSSGDIRGTADKVLFGVDKTDEPGTFQFALSELDKTGLQVLNVSEYGIEGDGETDNTANYLLLSAAIPSTGAVLYFPTGSYVGELIITEVDNLVIFGDGTSSKLLGGGAGENCLELVDCDRVEIRNIWLVGSGNSAASSVVVDNGIFADSCSNLTVENCRFSNHGFAGISTDDCQVVSIMENTFSDAAGYTSADSSDIYLGGSGVLFDYHVGNNVCRSANAVGINLSPSHTNLDHRRFIIANNVCTGHSRYGIAAKISLTTSTDDTLKAISVTGNTVESNGYVGIFLQNVEDSTITFNSTRANGLDGGSIEGGIFCQGCIGISIVGNSSDSEEGNGIRVDGHADYDNRRSGVTVFGNTVRDVQTAGHAGIFVGTSVEQCSVVANSLQGGSDAAIELDSSGSVTSYVSISDNAVNGNSTATSGILVGGSLANSTAVNNQISDATAGITVAGSAVAICRDNFLEDNTTDLVFSGTITDLRQADNRYRTLSNSATVSTATFTNGDSTPSVAGQAKVRTGSTTPTTISNLDDGVNGQVVFLLFADNQTTIDFTNSSMRGNGGSDFLGSTGDYLTCTRIDGIWYCDVVNN